MATLTKPCLSPLSERSSRASGDGKANACDPDSDNDDVDDHWDDPDNDTLPDIEDPDSDNDNIPDADDPNHQNCAPPVVSVDDVTSEL